MKMLPVLQPHLAADARAEVVHLDGRFCASTRGVRHLLRVQGSIGLFRRFMCPVVRRAGAVIQAIIDLQDKIQREGTSWAKNFRPKSASDEACLLGLPVIQKP